MSCIPGSYEQTAENEKMAFSIMPKTRYRPIDGDGAEHEPSAARALHTERRWRRIWSIVASVQLALLLVVAFVSWTHQPQAQTSSVRGGFPPAESGLRFRSQLFDKYGVRNSPTAQEPGPALDSAWHGLLSSMMVKISPEQMFSQTPESSIPLADGSGYVASLGVYHELHCIKLLKHWIHKDYYLAGWDEDRVEQYWKHLNHCLDWLKTAALCRSDTTITTLTWNGSILDTEYPVAYQCVDPDSLFAWTNEHAIDITDSSVLVQPTAV